MKIVYEDDLYEGKVKKYQGKTIKQILSEHPNPKAFITQFNSRNNNMCLSDEIAVNIRSLGNFRRGWERN